MKNEINFFKEDVTKHSINRTSHTFNEQTIPIVFGPV